jgi:nitroreductase
MKKILKGYYNKWKLFKADTLPSFFTGSGTMTSLYYLFFSSKFRREEAAVLAGKLKYLKEAKKDKLNLYTLIRNTHRIEKGLLMRPRRETFAVDFIGETIDNFVSVFNVDDCVSGSQIKWSHDVLKEYFNVTGTHPVIDRERIRFENIASKLSNERPTSIPYHRLEGNKPSISYDDFFKLTKFRRSVRWFLDKKVPHDLIDKAILAANQSPSACNRQPFEYRIIDDPQLLKEVVNIPGGVKGYANNIPMFIVAVGNLDAYFDERDRHVIYVDASLANMTLMLALETLGLSSCAINWPDVEPFEIRMERALKLEKWQRPIMCIGVGFPDPEGLVAFSEKRSIENLRKFN